MKVAVFGTGYVGLVAAVCFADSGNQVTGVDVDQEKISRLKDGIVPIYEPGLDDLLKPNLKAKRIDFTTDGVSTVKKSQILFVAVGTPEVEDGSADLSQVMGVVDLIASQMEEEKIIVLKSTVPVGTAEKVSTRLKEKTNFPFHVVSNPEFLKEGASVQDFLKPDRVVIGCDSEKARKTMAALYEPFVRGGKPILFMKNKAAELTKYAANAFLATKISFINELALLADSVGADIEEVKKGFTSDSRINPAFFYPGVGFGGSCFPKDVKALVKTAQEADLRLHVVTATDEANENQKKVLFRKIKKHFGNLTGLTFAVWGLSFKPRTDDVREAPSFVLLDSLLKEGARVTAYDPVAIQNSKKVFGDRVTWAADAYQALKGSDALVLVTEWNEFRSPDWSVIQSSLKKKVIFDGRNVFDPRLVRELGLTYYCIGRESVV